jgi:hypothetical protein
VLNAFDWPGMLAVARISSIATIHAADEVLY